MADQTASQELVIATILPTLTDMPAILSKAKMRAVKAQEAVTLLVQEFEEAIVNQPGGVLTAEQDEKALETIGKLSTQQEKMLSERSPFTQMMTVIAKSFTAEENKIPPLIAKLQPFRNGRAAWIVAENRRREEEARKQAQKDQERADIIAAITKSIASCLNNKMFNRKTELNNAFESLTLADIDERGAKMRSLIMTFPAAKLPEILIYQLPAGRHHSAEEVNSMDISTRQGYDFDSFYESYYTEMTVFKNGLVDRLDSKKAALLETKRLADESARIKKEQEQAAERQRELDRQAAQTKNAAEAERIKKQREQEAETQRLLDEQAKETQRIRDQEAAAEKVRQEAAAEKVRQEAADREAADAKVAEMTRTQSVAQSMFNEANVANVKEAEGETRKGWEIFVTEAAGWAQIHQFWFLGESANAWKKDPDKFGAMTYEKMKAYAEKVMKDKGEKIESPYLQYKETLKAVNRQKK